MISVVFSRTSVIYSFSLCLNSYTLNHYIIIMTNTIIICVLFILSFVSCFFLASSFSLGFNSRRLFFLFASCMFMIDEYIYLYICMCVYVSKCEFKPCVAVAMTTMTTMNFYGLMLVAIVVQQYLDDALNFVEHSMRLCRWRWQHQCDSWMVDQYLRRWYHCCW